MLVATATLVAVGCDSDDNETDRLEPAEDGVIEQEIDDSTLITDPGGATNNLDGEDNDIEDGPIDEDD